MLKNMIIFKFENVNGVEFAQGNLMNDGRKIPILHNNCPVGIVRNTKIVKNKIIGEVYWFTYFIECKPKKIFDSWEVAFNDDGTYELVSVVID